MHKLKKGLWIDEAQHESYKSFLEEREKDFNRFRIKLDKNWSTSFNLVDDYDASSIDKQNPYGKED